MFHGDAYFFKQPVKIIDPHLVSTFFDDYKRVYLHATIEIQNRSSWVADCSVKIQVTTELEGNICLVEHLQAQKVSVPAGSTIQYTYPQVGDYNLHLSLTIFLISLSVFNIFV